jgi:hypothetical protein
MPGFLPWSVRRDHSFHAIRQQTNWEGHFTDLERLAARSSRCDELTTAMNRFCENSAGSRLEAEGISQFPRPARLSSEPSSPSRAVQERLNEVTHEIGLLNGAFQSDCGEIRSKIDINQSL